MKRARLFIGLAFIAVAASLAGAQSRDSTTAPPVAQTAHDSFIGLDKPKHFVLSFFIESASFASMQAAGARRPRAMIGATLSTAAFGIGREIHDRKTKGLFSFSDLLWDALGAGTAAIMLRHTYR